MKTYTITITELVARSGRDYNRIAFDVKDKSGNTLNVLYPQCEDSLAVNNSVFQVATACFYGSTGNKEALAELYVSRSCCCSDKSIAVDGIKSLTVPAS